MKEHSGQAERDPIADGATNVEQKGVEREDGSRQAAAQDRKAIQGDIESEKALRTTLEELERQADELDAARALRREHLAAARRSSSHRRASSHKNA